MRRLWRGLLALGALALLLAACSPSGAGTSSRPTAAPVNPEGARPIPRVGRAATPVIAAPPAPSGQDAYTALAEARRVYKATVVLFYQDSATDQQQFAARLPRLIDDKYQAGKYQIATILANLDDPDSQRLTQELGFAGSAPLLITHDILGQEVERFRGIPNELQLQKLIIQLFVACQECAPPGSVPTIGPDGGG